MLLPSKHVPLDKSALGVAAIVLRDKPPGSTVSEAWEAARLAGVSTFDQFVAALDLLFLLDVIDLRNGRLVAS